MALCKFYKEEAMEKKKRRSGFNEKQIYLLGFLVILIIILGVMIMLRKYSPSKEKMALSDYYVLNEEDQAATIVNGVYEKTAKGAAVNAIVYGQKIYLELNFLKNKLDDGYVYDSNSGVMRYVTDKSVITVNQGSQSYQVDKDTKNFSENILVSENDTEYVALDFVKQYTDLSYKTNAKPNRVSIWLAGTKKTTATVTKNTQIRRFGGVKSKILQEIAKGSSVSIIEDYGKWSKVVTEKGVIGCIENGCLTEKSTQKVKATLAKRVYKHILLDEKVNLGWFQVTNMSANASFGSTIANTSGLNVISPTWFTLADNNGGIKNLSSQEVVTAAHNQGMQVWGLVSNLGNTQVDTTAVLSTTSARDTLVNNLVAAAIAANLDGINVDIEQLTSGGADGYIEFIKELSLKCEDNHLVLSVDNYSPTSGTSYYNRAVQAQYADYVIVMAYDEHYAGSSEAGSVASIKFVKNAVKNTLKEVPKKQLILGMPLYCRIWISDGTNLTSQAMGMKDIGDYLAQNGATTTWLENIGQYYAEFTKDNKTYKVWVEDPASLDLKLQVMKNKKLAGGAFWKLGFEPSTIWGTIGKYMK